MTPLIQKKASWLTLAIMLMIVLLAAIYISARDKSLIQRHKQTPAATALLIEDDAKSFTDSAGAPASLSEYFGQIMVVTSWASWCPTCAEGLSTLGTLATEYQSKNVVVLAVNRSEDTHTANRYLDTIQVPNSLRIILDPTDHFFQTTTGYAMPETIIYNKSGEVLLHQRGDINIEEIKDILKKQTE